MFEQLRGNGRVWIYTAKRPLTQEERTLIDKELPEFLASWAAHGKKLMADYQIIHDQMIILAVDEDLEQATGCSIDTATQWFTALDRQLDLDLFNRMNLAFLTEGNFQLIPMHELNAAYEDGRIRPDSTFYNNAVSQLHALNSEWMMPFKDSWAFKRIQQQV